MGDDCRRSLCMDGFFYGSATYQTNLPVSAFVACPFRTYISMRAGGVVIAFVQALVVGIAPVFCKVFALHAEVVVATHRLCIRLAAVVAEFAVVAAVETFVAVAALLADEVVEVVLERSIIWAIAVLAMFLTVLALTAVLAEFVYLEAFAAVRAEVLVPLGAFRTNLVLAMVVLHTLLAQSAVFALIIVWALHTVGTQMVVELARLYAVVVSAARILRIGFTATLAKATFITEILTFGW